MSREINIHDFYTLLLHDDPKRLVVDVRLPFEVKSGKIKGAINIPMDQVLSQTDLLAGYDAVYVVCQSGGRSLLTQTQLEIAGLTTVCNVVGGMRAWKENGYPIEIEE